MQTHEAQCPLSMDAIRIKEYEAEAELLRLEAAAIDDLLVKERLLAQSSLASLRAKQIAIFVTHSTV
ncbi:hypothetical protein LOK85_12295 [Xylella fastidiosa subsp. multiplex]|uniref:hypothetical protein n=1 Tax=Xylella fastidiosa TaxID=2371 RepID=UPI00234D4831|nr:hypothetical protein [Xylella fastidiosa]MDC6416653.1 hypothetical protein [Xylella fastidiosa subsp. multiplex]